MSCGRLGQREARNACGCPRRWQLRHFTLKTKNAISTQNRKNKPQRGGKGTLRRYKGMGQEPPAVRAARGTERLRLPAAVVVALLYPENKFAVLANNKKYNL